MFRDCKVSVLHSSLDKPLNHSESAVQGDYKLQIDYEIKRCTSLTLILRNIYNFMRFHHVTTRTKVHKTIIYKK